MAITTRRALAMGLSTLCLCRKTTMRISNRYSGQSGLYASVKPIRGFAKLRTRLHELGVEEITPQDDVHCTLIYSRNTAPHVVKVGSLLTQGPYNFHATPKEVKWWAGHDEKGYLVLELESHHLHDRHLNWKELGAKHSFPDYVPHITLASPFEEPKKAWLNTINKAIQTESLPLVFGGEHAEDIKP